jgi:hypothetical protein
MDKVKLNLNINEWCELFNLLGNIEGICAGSKEYEFIESSSQRIQEILINNFVLIKDLEAK